MRAVTAVSWIPCGVTPPVLMESQTTEAEMSAYIGVIEGRVGKKPEPEAPVSAEDAEIIKRYNFENYDEEGDDGVPEGIVPEDPYQTGPIQPDEADEDDKITVGDLLLMVGKTGDEIPTLEVQLFDPKEESLYVHHEVMISSFPLNIRWLDCEPTTSATGSFAAISTYESFIEVWNMNIRDPMAPRAVLQMHEAAVPGLAWNVLQRGLLLSASVDQKAAIWSLETCSPGVVFNVGAQCKACEWSPVHDSIFGIATDQGAVFYEARQPTPTYSVLNGTAVETFAWAWDGEHFVAGDITGHVSVFDVKNPQTPMAHVQVHEQAVTAVAMCKAAPIIATVGEDGFCRMMKMDNGQLSPFAEEKLSQERLYTASFCPDKPTLLAVGGDGDEAQLWDIANILSQ